MIKEDFLKRMEMGLLNREIKMELIKHIMTIYKLTATLHYVAILHEHWKEREKGGDKNLTQGKTLKERKVMNILQWVVDSKSWRRSVKVLCDMSHKVDKLRVTSNKISVHMRESLHCLERLWLIKSLQEAPLKKVYSRPKLTCLISQF